MIVYGMALIGALSRTRSGVCVRDVYSFFVFPLHAAARRHGVGELAISVHGRVGIVAESGRWGPRWFPKTAEDARTMGAALMHTATTFVFSLPRCGNVFIGSHYGCRYMFALGGAPALCSA